MMIIHRSTFIGFTILLAGTLFGADRASKPNVVFFFIDDLGWTDLGYMGSKYYESPHVDKLAKDGMVFMNAYANAAGYGAVPAFTAYPITGDAEGWLASIGIPAITVELKTYQSIEWAQNLAGVNAILSHFGNKNLAR